MSYLSAEFFQRAVFDLIFAKSKKGPHHSYSSKPSLQQTDPRDISDFCSSRFSDRRTGDHIIQQLFSSFFYSEYRYECRGQVEDSWPLKSRIS